MKVLRVVSSPSGDWEVIYSDDGSKLWEGYYVDSNAVYAIAKHFDHGVRFCDFTDEDEIDGCTPDNFYDIKGIRIYRSVE